MTIKDLKTGMFVVCRDDTLRLVLRNTLISLNGGGGVTVDDYENNMEHLGQSAYDIMEVYAEPQCVYLGANLTFWMTHKRILEHAELLWKRKHILEVTMDDIEEKYGCKVKVISTVKKSFANCTQMTGEQDD